MKAIRTEQTGKTLLITLNRPEVKNPMGPELLSEILELCTSADIDKVIVNSVGSVFCAGGDLKQYSKFTSKQQGVELHAKMRDLCDQFSKLKLHKLALVSGDCFGGGIEFLSCFETIYSLPHCCFHFWQKRNGLSYGWGGAKRLEARMGQQKVQNFINSVATLTAGESLTVGLVDKILLPFDIERVVKNWESRHRRNLITSESLTADEGAIFDELWWSELHQKSLKPFR